MNPKKLKLKKRNHSIFIEALSWFDKINGNSYFSVKLQIDGETVARLPFQYGYGSQYSQEVYSILGFNSYCEFKEYCRENKIAVYETKNQAKKTEVVKHGEW